MKIVDEVVERVTTIFALEGERLRNEVAAGLAITNRGLRVNAAAYRPFAQYSNQVATNGSGRLLGWSARATGGAMTVTLHDGHEASGDAIAAFTVADGATAHTWMGPQGVSFTEGLYVEVSGAGQLVGAVHLGAVD